MDLELNSALESQEIRLERGSLLWSNDIKCIVNGHSVMCKSVVKMLFNAADLSHHHHLDLRLIAAKKILLWSYFHDTFFLYAVEKVISYTRSSLKGISYSRRAFQT